jgi:hypothetical protein
LPPAHSGLRPTPSQLQSAKDLRAISFTENKGQAPAGILWTMQGVNYRAGFSKGSFVLQTVRPMPEALETGKRANKKALPVTASTGAVGSIATGQNEILKVQIEEQRIELEGANPLSKIEPLDERPGKVSFFEGKDPSHWVKGASTYARLRYKEIYPGIDLVFYGKEGRLEYDFVVAAGADPSLIRMKIDGNDTVSITDQGELRATWYIARSSIRTWSMGSAWLRASSSRSPAIGLASLSPITTGRRPSSLIRPLICSTPPMPGAFTTIRHLV